MDDTKGRKNFADNIILRQYIIISVGFMLVEYIESRISLPSLISHLLAIWFKVIRNDCERYNLINSSTLHDIMMAYGQLLIYEYKMSVFVYSFLFLSVNSRNFAPPVGILLFRISLIIIRKKSHFLRWIFCWRALFWEKKFLFIQILPKSSQWNWNDKEMDLVEIFFFKKIIITKLVSHMILNWSSLFFCNSLLAATKFQYPL